MHHRQATEAVGRLGYKFAVLVPLKMRGRVNLSHGDGSSLGAASKAWGQCAAQTRQDSSTLDVVDELAIVNDVGVELTEVGLAQQRNRPGGLDRLNQHT